MNDCILCGLVSGDLEASVAYEDDRTKVFMDIQPVVRGHMLVVPRRHSPFLADLDEEDGAQLFRVGSRAAAALRASRLPCDGVNFFLADGEAAGQEIFHVHLHVFPRVVGDGFSLRMPPDYVVRSRPELDDSAQLVRKGWA